MARTRRRARGLRCRRHATASAARMLVVAPVARCRVPDAAYAGTRAPWRELRTRRDALRQRQGRSDQTLGEIRLSLRLVSQPASDGEGASLPWSVPRVVTSRLIATNRARDQERECRSPMVAVLGMLPSCAIGQRRQHGVRRVDVDVAAAVEARQDAVRAVLAALAFEARAVQAYPVELPLDRGLLEPREVGQAAWLVHERRTQWRAVEGSGASHGPRPAGHLPQQLAVVRVQVEMRVSVALRVSRNCLPPPRNWSSFWLTHAASVSVRIRVAAPSARSTK